MISDIEFCKDLPLKALLFEIGKWRIEMKRVP